MAPVKAFSEQGEKRAVRSNVNKMLINGQPRDDVHGKAVTRAIAPTLCRLLGIRPPNLALQPPIRAVIDAMGRQERLSLVVIDSLGENLRQIHCAHLPCLNALAVHGHMVLEAEKPPYTPVNIATMATGASFEQHRVRKRRDRPEAQTFHDVMDQCAMKARIVAGKESTLSLMIPGAAVPVAQSMPDGDLDVQEAAKEVMRGLRPDFLWIYFTGFDGVSHRHGPESAEAGQALSLIDRALGELMPLFRLFGYGVLITADHGHHCISRDGMKGIHDGSVESDLLVPLVWSASAPLSARDR